jgi:hypothetical protein
LGGAKKPKLKNFFKVAALILKDSTTNLAANSNLVAILHKTNFPYSISAY